LFSQQLLASPEVKLLLCCTRTSRSPETASRVRALLGEDIDWEHLIRVAHRHGIAPLLYWHLDNTCPRTVPENAFNHLRNHFRANTLRNLSLTRDLLRLLKAFERHEIPAITYKGPALTTSVYGNLALREFSDLDILIREQDVSRATELLISAGYRSGYPEHQMTHTQEAVLRRTEFEYDFTRDDSKSSVDLHWAIMPTYLSVTLNLEGLWKRLEPTSLGGETVLTFSPEDLLLILCVHGSKHLWEQLKLICDVAELIRARKDMNWGRVLKQAGTLGNERMVLLGLFLAKELLGAVLPKEVMQRVEADPVVKVLARQVEEQLLCEANEPRRVLEEILFHLKTKERLKDKIRYCVRLSTAINMRDWAALPLPGYLFPLYYLIRPVRLVRKYGRRLLEPLLRPVKRC
jgi:Uncharacterised nucleotidyltransferase